MAIREQLNGKTASQRATIKGIEVAKVLSVKKTSRVNYSIEILEIKPIEKGVEVFVKAWDSNGQIGFGKDGTVDVERFVFINPPILVADPNGTIRREWNDEATGESGTNTYREDPKEALLQSLEHTIAVKKQKFDNSKIVKGRVGNTTTTVYSNAGGDGFIGYAAFDAASWATQHDATTGGDVQGTGTSGSTPYVGKQAGGEILLRRAYFPFDTSSVADTDTVDSAIFSVYHGAEDDSGDDPVGVVTSAQASGTALVAGDYDALGSTFISNTINTNSFTGNAYNNFTLDSSGEAEIDFTGYTFLALRTDKDRSNTEPSSSTFYRISIYFADQTGTTNDPKLVVEHSAGVTTVSSTISAKARVIKQGQSSTVQSKARVEQLGVSKTIQAKARVLRQAESSSIQAKAFIQTAGAHTITAKATVQQSDVAKTVQAKGRILQEGESSNIQARGRIELTESDTITAKGRIEQLGVAKTVQAKAKISGMTNQTIQAKAAVVQEVDRTLEARARIEKLGVAKTISAKGRVKLQEKGFVKLRSEQQSWPITFNDNRIL